MKKIDLQKFSDWLERWHVTRILGSLSSFLLIATLIGYYFSYQSAQSKKDNEERNRAFNAWQLITTKAVGNSGKKEALEYLVNRGENLRGINLSVPKGEIGVYLEGVNIQNAILRRSNFERANLRKANLIRADLTHSNLEGAYLYEANLTGAVLASANFRSSSLVEANLEYAKALEISLEKADLLGTMLKHSNLAGANLSYADLSYSNLYRADFTNSLLYNVNLLNTTNLTCKQLKTARAWKTAYRDLKFSCGESVPEVPGLVPDWLKGSLYEDN